MVYDKSMLGYNEFINDKRTLNVRERQVLVLVNGVRNIDDLEKFFKKDHLMETIQKLELHGFIQPFKSPLNTNGNPIANTTPSTGSSFFSNNQAAATVNPENITAVKTILINATDDYLGLMGRSLKERIANCDSEVDLKTCISSWHMAMRESKLGRESTSFLMEQIHQTLDNKIIDDKLDTLRTH